eukprot:436500_1
MAGAIIMIWLGSKTEDSKQWTEEECLLVSNGRGFESYSCPDADKGIFRQWEYTAVAEKCDNYTQPLTSELTACMNISQNAPYYMYNLTTCYILECNETFSWNPRPVEGGYGISVPVVVIGSILLCCCCIGCGGYNIINWEKNKFRFECGFRSFFISFRLNSQLLKKKKK